MDYKQIMKDRLELFEAIETINKSTYFVVDVHWYTCLVFGLDEASYREIQKDASWSYYSDWPYNAEDEINHLKNEINENGANLLIINNE